MAQINLTDQELLLLDGRIENPQLQKEIDSAKQRLDYTWGIDYPNDAIKALASQMAQYAAVQGKISFSHINLRRCSVCKESAGYDTYKKSGRYHRKGEINTSKPLFMGGLDFDSSLVKIMNHTSLGCCNECYELGKTSIAATLLKVKAEIAPVLMNPVHKWTPKYKRWDNMECTRCGWTGHQGEMTEESTLFDNGKYKAGCPQCGAKNTLFSQPIKHLNTFTLVEINPGANGDTK